MKPTNGRVVLYTPPRGAAIAYQGVPLAATVAHVWSDTCVNIGYLDANGMHHHATSVMFWHADGDVPQPSENFAQWMPYQLGQASKAAELVNEALKVGAAASANLAATSSESPAPTAQAGDTP